MNPLEKLNHGKLVPVASIRKFRKTKRQALPLDTRGRVFRVGVLHGMEFTENVLKRNRRGYINSQVNTVAHAPSIYHWLFCRCGIPFEESQKLVEQHRLLVAGAPVTGLADLEKQHPWEHLRTLDLQVVNENGKTVPALHRSAHRQYHLMAIRPGISLSSDLAEPRTFVHRLAPKLGPVAAIGLNILRPIGFVDGMRGLGLATNDVSMVRHWNNECLGNFGIYDIRFMRGTPTSEVVRLQTVLQKALAAVEAQLPGHVLSLPPCDCKMEAVPPNKDVVKEKLLPDIPLNAERLVVRTPLLPYRCVSQLRAAGAYINLTRSGPFILPFSLPEKESRLLTTPELAVMLNFERRLKVNRVILSLHEFENADDN